MRRFALVLAALPLVFTAFAAEAAPQKKKGMASARSADQVDYLVPYLGYFDILGGDNDAAQLGLEYRFHPWDYGFRPTVGANLSTDGSFYLYGGFNWDVAVTDNLYFIPNFAVGAYHSGDGKDLGGALEFRSGIEVAYQMPNLHRVGIAFNHISNASIYDKNPGAETLLINYSVPTAKLFEW